MKPAGIFAAQARSFCDWLREGKEGGGAAAREALGRLLRLYAAALELPGSNGTGSSGETPRVSEEVWKEVFTACRRFPVQYYGEVFDPLPVPPGEPVLGDLADDFADIYRDLCAGLDLYDRGDTQGAIWAWRFSLQYHWGEHATGAIRVLHCWLAANDELAV